MSESRNVRMSDRSGDEGGVGLEPLLEFMERFGNLCNTDSCLDRSNNYLGPDCLERQRQVVSQHTDVELCSQPKDLPRKTATEA